ncbi:MAG: branched-chain amino acid ABC transporter permease [Ilumatobacteraceae bacterium]
MPLKIAEGSAGHWVIRLVWAAAVIALILYIPAKTNAGTVNDITLAIEFAIAALSLNLVLGYTGIISLGHSAFFGIGMYTTAILVVNYGWSQGWTLFAAAAVAFAVGCLVALPALRLTGIYLAVVTLAVAVLFPTLVKWNKLAWLTGGPAGLSGVSYDDIPSWPLLGELKGREGRTKFVYWLGILLLAISYAVARGIVKSRVGRSLIAIRDNDTASAVMGVHRARTKTLVFGISAAVCALAGSLAAIRLNIASPDIPTLTLIGSITFLLIMVLGGAATLWGPIIGALAYVMIDARTREAGASGEGIIGTVFNDWLNFTGSPATLILAIILLVVVFVAPFGIVGLLKLLASKAVVIVPRPAGGTIDEDHLLVSTEAAAEIEAAPGAPHAGLAADPFTTRGEPT